MKAFLLTLALFAAASGVCAQTSVVEWWLDGDSTKVYSTQTKCDDAARALNLAKAYPCPRMLRVTPKPVPCPSAPSSTQTVACVAPAVGSWTQTRTVTSAPSPTCWSVAAWTPAAAPAGACVVPSVPPPSGGGTWTRLASENEAFTVGTGQTVRFGRDPAWVQKVVSGVGQCTLAFFASDPAPGQGKFCEVLDGSGTPVVGVPPAPPTSPAMGSATLSWVAPTKNADGTTIADLAGYRVLYGVVSGGPYTDALDTSPPLATTIVVPALTTGKWFFVVRARDTSGNLSAPSAEVSKVVP